MTPRTVVAIATLVAIVLFGRPVAAENLDYYLFDATGVEALDRWQPIGGMKLSLSDNCKLDTQGSLQADLAVSKASQRIDGLRLSRLALPMPKVIRFRIWPDAVHLFVAIGDRAGRRLTSRIPISFPPRWEWSEVSVPTDEMMTMGIGGSRPTDFDFIELLTRESASAFNEGSYRFRFEHFEAGYAQGEAPKPFVYSKEDLARDLGPLESKVAAIDMLIAQGRRAGLQLRYETATRTMLARYRTELVAMYPDLTQRDAQREARYVSERADATVTRLRTLLAHPEREVRVPDVHLQNLRSREGSFFAGNRPVILAGLCGWFAPETFDQLAASGYTSVSMEIGPSVTLPKEGEKRPDAVQPMLRSMDAARDHNIAVDMLLSPHYFPDWARRKWPQTDATGWRQKTNGFMPWTITDPHVRDVIADHLAVAVPMLRSHPALISYDLMNEAWYRMIPDYPAAAFDAYRRAHPTESYWQAATSYTTGTFTDFTRWYVGQVHRYDRVHPIQTKVFDSQDQQSVDREATGDLQTANGMDVMPSYPDHYGQLAANFAYPLLRHDFHRSLTPDKPILDGEYHISDGKFWQPPAYFKAALWALALHGRDVCDAWVLDRVDDGSIYCHPAAVEALGHAALDFLRLGPEIHAFQRQTGDLALFFGGSNTREAYLACLFQDRDVRIVTAKRVRAGVLSRCRALVLPANCEIPSDVARTIARFEARGGRVVRCGPGARGEDVWPEVHQASASCAPAAVQTGAWGVECRSVVRGGRRLFYVLNHRRTPVTIRPRSAWPVGAAHDLLTMQSTDAHTLRLGSLGFRLLEVR